MARWWAGRRGAPDEVANLTAEAAALNVQGLPPSAGLPRATLRLWPCNASVAQVFFAMGSQWRWIVIAGWGEVKMLRTGLDYAALPVVLAAHGLTASREILADIAIMEAAALPLLNE